MAAEPHVMAMGTTEIALTAHVVMPDSDGDDAFLIRATQQLHDRFAIEQVTRSVVARACDGPVVLPLPER